MFSSVVTKRLHDLLADNTLELFVDNGGTADNTFQGMMNKLKCIFQRCREHSMSLSPTKCQLLMTKTTFAGATVGPHGVQPDLAKLTTVVNWAQPDDALNLVSFLGLTGHFRDLIRGYAKVEGPLWDLLKSVNLPRLMTKTTYCRTMATYKLREKWTAAQTTAFLNLKTVLTSQPVLHAPRYDGTPFIVTMDGCQEGLGAVLTQRTSI